MPNKANGSTANKIFHKLVDPEKSEKYIPVNGTNTVDITLLQQETQ